MFHNLPLSVNITTFSVSAVVTWIAGSRLAYTADAIADKTGIGREFVGILPLGGITSLPEIAVATTATLQGTPILSVNDVLGSAAINIMILPIADATTGRGALTSMQGSPVVLLQGVLGIVMMALAIGSLVAGDILIFGVGAWCWLMLTLYLAAICLLAKSQATLGWQSLRHTTGSASSKNQGVQSQGLDRLIGQTVATGSAILVAGFLLARTGEMIAEQSGLGNSFFGAVFLGASTSLPEVSTVIAALRLRQYEMAISGIFGTNLFNVAIIVLVDALHPGDPILVEAGRFAGFAALLALVLTAFFLIGMIERRDRAILRMGYDSLAAFVVDGAGIAILYHLR